MNAEATTAMSPKAQVAVQPAPAKPGRLWPAVALVVLFWTVHLVMGRLDKFYFVAFLFNLGSAALLALLFTVWWWTNRGITLRSRFLGFLLVIVAGALVEPFCHASIGWWGLLMTGLPI